MNTFPINRVKQLPNQSKTLLKLAFNLDWRMNNKSVFKIMDGFYIKRQNFGWFVVNWCFAHVETSSEVEDVDEH